MTTVTTSQAAAHTYKEVADVIFAYHSSQETRFTNLSKLIQTPLEQFATQAKKFAANEHIQFLREGVDKSYDFYESIILEHGVAVEALQKFQEALKSLTPGNVRLTPDLVMHMTKLGVDMEDYHKREEAAAQSCVELRTIAQGVQELVNNTQKFTNALKPRLGLAVYDLHRLEGKTGYTGLLWSAETYFMAGLEEHRKPPVDRVSTTSATAGSLEEPKELVGLPAASTSSSSSVTETGQSNQPMELAAGLP